MNAIVALADGEPGMRLNDSRGAGQAIAPLIGLLFPAWGRQRVTELISLLGVAVQYGNINCENPWFGDDSGRSPGYHPTSEQIRKRKL